MSHSQQDRDRVAAKENEESEVKYIAKTYHIPMKVVRATMLEIGKNGKPAVMRDDIYAALRLKGYVIDVKEDVKGEVGPSEIPAHGPYTECPNCSAVWGTGTEEYLFQQCYSCGWQSGQPIDTDIAEEE